MTMEILVGDFGDKSGAVVFEVMIFSNKNVVKNQIWCIIQSCRDKNE